MCSLVKNARGVGPLLCLDMYGEGAFAIFCKPRMKGRGLEARAMGGLEQAASRLGEAVGRYASRLLLLRPVSFFKNSFITFSYLGVLDESGRDLLFFLRACAVHLGSLRSFHDVGVGMAKWNIESFMGIFCAWIWDGGVALNHAHMMRVLVHGL